MLAERATRIALALLALLAFVVALDNLERPLANPDEGRYSEISREMALSGDWVTPRLNGIKYFEKPPLQYWATAISFKVFGEGERAARLYVALSGLATILVIGFTAWRLYSAECGVLAMLALLSSPYFLGMGAVATLDMGLTLWTTATLCAFLLARGAARDERERRRWLLVAWAATAMAVLSKGLVGLVFPAAAMFLHTVITRDWRALTRLEWGRGALVFLAIAAPWFIAVSLANPEFPEFFFVHEHFTRYVTQEHKRVEPWWYFLPILFAGFLPWMFALPAAARRAWLAERGSGVFPALTFALAWAGFIVVFFSASGSKLPGYILPAFPALALVLARFLETTPATKLAAWLAPLVPLALALMPVAWQMPDRARDEWTRALFVAAQPWALAAIAVTVLAITAAVLLLRRGDRWLGIIVVAMGTAVLVDCAEDAFEEFSPRQSGKAIAEKALRYAKPDTRLYSLHMYDQTVTFYMGRTWTLADHLDEFREGLKSEPQRAIKTVAEFRADWARPGEAMAIMHPYDATRMQHAGIPIVILHSDPRRALIRKP